MCTSCAQIFHYLKDTISDLSPINSLSLLNNLYVADNNLTDVDLSSLHNLYNVSVEDNQITQLLLPDSASIYLNLSLNNNILHSLIFPLSTGSILEHQIR